MDTGLAEPVRGPVEQLRIDVKWPRRVLRLVLTGNNPLGFLSSAYDHHMARIGVSGVWDRSGLHGPGQTDF
jgi:hypothetical protein